MSDYFSSRRQIVDVNRAPIDLRLRILHAALREFEINGFVVQGTQKNDELPHTLRLVYDGNYCVEHSRKLVQEYNLSRNAAHALILEEVRSEYPDLLPFYSTSESLAKEWQARKMSVRDIRKGRKE